MKLEDLSEREQARVRAQFEQGTIAAMEKYATAPAWLRMINPLRAAIVNGDFELYAKLLESASDEVLAQEVRAPGTGLEVQPDDVYYEMF